MESIEGLIAQASAFQRLPPEHRRTISGCGRTAVFEPGDLLMHEGDSADVFYIIRSGTVALQMPLPHQARCTIETLGQGQLLGWSWLFPPYRTIFDARALERTHTLLFDGACLRGKCDADPRLGYDLFKLFAGVVIDRLQNTRMQLANVYDAVPEI